MREISPLYENPSVVNIWADLQQKSFKKGKILNVFKVKHLKLAQYHNEQLIEHVKFTKDEQSVVFMSSDFKVSIWTVGAWEFKRTFRAYHNMES